ncbi:MAG: hypothetical protein COW84_02305 [Gammaproteobacteria bacterium CG22_combo_CG10-13_8_21_14_all_40_8]|nr:MAG: hypothetical protein COW84_02305 [Gammaproteobacteria bacterium CG22_combo_CG10-13_8_21_14_all_40_8]
MKQTYKTRFKTAFAKRFPSLRSRLLTTSSLLVALFIIAAALVLQNAFKYGLLAKLQDQLEAQTYALLSVAEEEKPGKLFLPEALADTRFNQLAIASGRFARVVNSDNQVLWESLSAQGLDWAKSEFIAPGTSKFYLSHIDGHKAYQRDFGVVFESSMGDHAYMFQVAEENDGIKFALFSFKTQLYSWLLILAFVFVLLQFIFVHYGLGPLKKVALELNDIENGVAQRLSSKYPLEINLLTARINQLLQFEENQRARYRDSLGDLAHSLKTPLSVLTTSIEKKIQGTLAQDLDLQVTRINKTLSYYLNKASARGVGSTLAPVKLCEIVNPLVDALNKVYYDKQITCLVELENEVKFYGHEGDMMELLGNLLDNAFKYGKRQTAIRVSQVNKKLSITIEDDGPGIQMEKRDRAMKRGARLDETGDILGHGLGLSVVADIIAAYEGEISISDSKLGGAKFEVLFTC